MPDVRYSPVIPDRQLFAKGTIRFEGEILAAVAATTQELARAAVDAIVVRYEELDAVTDLEAAIAQLNYGEAAAITLCHSFGFSHQEVAEIVDTPLGTVKSQIRRGMEKLKLVFSDAENSDTIHRQEEAI